MRHVIALFMKGRRCCPGASSGQSIVELGLMLPILAMLLVGIVDLGRIYYAYITVVNVSREGARYAAGHPPRPSCDPGLDVEGLAAIETRARKEAEASGINPGQLRILVSCVYYNNPFEQPVKVTVWYDFQMIAARILGMPPVKLKAETTMQIFAQ